MVKSRPSNLSKINRALTKLMIEDIFGRKDLILRRVTETIDAFGQLSARTTSDTTFTGDLQFGPDLNKKYISTGIVEIGDAVLYIFPSSLSVLPSLGDQVIDNASSSKWRIDAQIEAPELGGDVVHYSYRCKRLIESSDT
jgi:hypothetical protein